MEEQDQETNGIPRWRLMESWKWAAGLRAILQVVMTWGEVEAAQTKRCHGKCLSFVECWQLAYIVVVVCCYRRNGAPKE
jgi:hypothetical protein